MQAAAAGDDVPAKAAADAAIQQALVRVNAVAEQYPDLKANQNFLELQGQLAETENQIAFARQYYNDAVASLNKLVMTIPWMLFTGIANVHKREFYDAPEGQQVAPQVSFGTDAPAAPAAPAAPSGSRRSRRSGGSGSRGPGRRRPLRRPLRRRPRPTRPQVVAPRRRPPEPPPQHRRDPRVTGDPYASGCCNTPDLTGYPGTRETGVRPTGERTRRRSARGRRPPCSPRGARP